MNDSIHNLIKEEILKSTDHFIYDSQKDIEILNPKCNIEDLVKSKLQYLNARGDGEHRSVLIHVPLLVTYQVSDSFTSGIDAR